LSERGRYGLGAIALAEDFKWTQTENSRQIDTRTGKSKEQYKLILLTDKTNHSNNGTRNKKKLPKTI
jgi:mRNA degradation ribonuclease J1/J2